MVVKHVMLSQKNSADWGVQALKAPFDILRLPLADCAKKGTIYCSTVPDC